MISITPATGRRLAMPLLLLGMTGCAGMGGLGDILAAGTILGGSEVSGEVRTVDARRQEIEIRNNFGRNERIRYDNRTQVVYQQRRYEVRNLERGDHIRARVDSDRNGRQVATYITVQNSVSDRGGTTRGARVQRFDGTVSRVDTSRGWFELDQGRGSILLVTLPYEPDRSTRDRFRRLRRGDRVRIEGEVLNNSRVEIRRFL